MLLSLPAFGDHIRALQDLRSCVKRCHLITPTDYLLFADTMSSATAISPLPPPPRWVVEMNNPVTTKKSTNGIPDPPGFLAAKTSGGKVITSSKNHSLVRTNRSVPEISSGSTKRANTRRDSDTEIEKGLGNCFRTCEATTHAGYYGVYVWKLAANILHHDGVHAVSFPFCSEVEIYLLPDQADVYLLIVQVQKPHTGRNANEPGVFKVRERRLSESDDWHQGSLCSDAISSTGSGSMEGE